MRNEYELLQITEPERIVISHPDPAHSFQLTVLLTEEDGTTRLAWCMRFESVEHCRQVKPFVVAANEQNLDRLEAELTRMV